MNDILEQSALDQSAAIERGDLSAAELMQATLDQIEAVNGPVNAIVALRDGDALIAEAHAADKAPRKGWLHGIPMAIKDLAHAKGIVTSKGSPLFKDDVAQHDDEMVRRLRAAGALIIGKTNTPEFGLGSHTFNPVYGATRNPYNTDKSAGGSSGGAAAALAARMLSVADGSDMMGSLRNPAGWNNVYGMRPTWGTVPAEPEREMFLQHLATSGPMARNPRDLAALLDTMTGVDPREPMARETPDCLPQMGNVLARQRIAWLGDWGGSLPFDAGILDLSEAALKQMQTLGHGVDSIAAPFDSDQIWQSWIDLRSYAVAMGLLADYEDAGRHPFLKPAALWEVERGIAMSGIDIHKASRVRSDWFRTAAALFEKVDVLVLPSAQVWPFDVTMEHPTEIAGVAMDTYHRWMQVVVPASLLGLPVVNVPIGFGHNGLPAGLQLIGPRGSDARLLQLAQEWHEVTDWPGARPPVI